MLMPQAAVVGVGSRTNVSFTNVMGATVPSAKDLSALPREHADSNPDACAFHRRETGQRIGDAHMWLCRGVRGQYWKGRRAGAAGRHAVESIQVHHGEFISSRTVAAAALDMAGDLPMSRTTARIPLSVRSGSGWSGMSNVLWGGAGEFFAYADGA